MTQKLLTLQVRKNLQTPIKLRGTPVTVNFLINSSIGNLKTLRTGSDQQRDAI